MGRFHQTSSPATRVWGVKHSGIVLGGSKSSRQCNLSYLLRVLTYLLHLHWVVKAQNGECTQDLFSALGNDAQYPVVSPLVYRPVPAVPAPECGALVPTAASLAARHPPLAPSSPLISTPPLVIPSLFERSRGGNVRVALTPMRRRSVQMRRRSVQMRRRSVQMRHHERLERGGDNERSGRRRVQSLRWVAHLGTVGVGVGVGVGVRVGVGVWGRVRLGLGLGSGLGLGLGSGSVSGCRVRARAARWLRRRRRALRRRRRRSRR